MSRSMAGGAKPKKMGKTIKQFLAVLSRWSFQILAALILSITSTICGVFGPKILGDMTNVAVESFQGAVIGNDGHVPPSDVLVAAIDWGKIGNLALILIGLYLASAALSYIEGVIFARVSAHYAQKTREEIIEKIARLPIAYFDRNQIGDTISRINNDVDMVSNTLANMLTQMMSAVTTLVGIFIMMTTISVSLSMLALVVIPLSLVFVAMTAKKAQKYFRAQQRTLGALNSIIEEDFSGQTLIKVNTHEPQVIQEFMGANQKLCESSWRAQFFSALAFPITNIFTNLNYVIICVVGGGMAIDGKLLIGSVQAFIQYVSQFNRPITEVSQISSNLQQALAAAERIFELLDESEETPDPADALMVPKVRGEVEFNHVDFGYHKNETTIQDFSIKIEPGMEVAIVGPTGAGKTTMINLLMRFYDPTAGYIAIDGVPTREMRRADVRKMFGMVLQDTWLFSGTIEENLKYGNSKATFEDIVKAAKACHVHHFIESLPKGYKTEITEDSDNISAGEKQLLTIVRAMVANPPMMILDEATSNVDTRTEQLIQEAFQKLTKGRTSFIIAHRLSTIRNADLIIVMKEGKIMEQGKHEELLEKKGFYAELYNSQFAKGK